MRISRIRILGRIVGGSRSAALPIYRASGRGPCQPRFRSDRSVGFSLRPDPTRKLRTDNDSDWNATARRNREGRVNFHVSEIARHVECGSRFQANRKGLPFVDEPADDALGTELE
jgi:hypothetical protein